MSIDTGVFIRLRSNLFYQKFLKTDRRPRYARHKRFCALGRGGSPVKGKTQRVSCGQALRQSSGLALRLSPGQAVFFQ